MFPDNAITISQIFDGSVSSTIIIPTYPSTLLGVNISQENLASNTNLYCGNELVLTNFAKTTEFMLIHKICNDVVRVQKAGNDKAQLLLTYVPYDISQATSTERFFYGFSYGDIVISLFVFWIFSFLIFNFIVAKFIGFFNKK